MSTTTPQPQKAPTLRTSGEEHDGVAPNQDPDTGEQLGDDDDDPPAALPGAPAQKRIPKGKPQPPPRRRARLVVDLEADSPQELAHALKRLLSRVVVGAPNWTELSGKVTGSAKFELREFSLAGEPYLRALEAWKKEEAAREKKGPAK